MAIHYLNITDLRLYPDEYISKSMLRAISNDGLITPLVYDDRTGEIHPDERERFMAFVTIAASHLNGATTILVCDWSGLTPSEQHEYN